MILETNNDEIIDLHLNFYLLSHHPYCEVLQEELFQHLKLKYLPHQIGE